jgi:cytochrome c oxidase assembly protein subunit 15
VLNLARISLSLVVILVVVSAYLRLQHSGVGCPDWPACYGMIGTQQAESENRRTRTARLAQHLQLV